MRDLREFGVLSFDCYGTLIDWETGILDQLRPWLASHHVEPSDSEILEVFGQVESSQEAETPQLPYPQVLEEVHREMASRWELPHDVEAARRFGHSVGSWPPFRDSHDALTRLGNRYRLVILSNVDRASFARSKALLGVDFDAIYTAQDIGSYKPDPRNFEHLIEQEAAAGHGSRDILHVGQSLFHDHLPANRAGLATCWIQRPSPTGELGATRPPDQRPDLDFHFTSLAELAEAVFAPS